MAAGFLLKRIPPFYLLYRTCRENVRYWSFPRNPFEEASDG